MIRWARATMARWMLGPMPPKRTAPSLEEVQHMLGLARAAKAEGRSYAPIPVDDVVGALAEFEEEMSGSPLRRNAARYVRRGDGASDPVLGVVVVVIIFLATILFAMGEHQARKRHASPPKARTGEPFHQWMDRTGGQGRRR